jgi:hypothetical protein
MTAAGWAPCVLEQECGGYTSVEAATGSADQVPSHSSSRMTVREGSMLDGACRIGTR